MLVAFSFRAKRGKEREFERLLNDSEMALYFAKAMGATRNMLFLKEGQMIRVLEFPDAARPSPMLDLASTDPKIEDFLRRMGPIIEDGFDFDQPESLDAFSIGGSRTRLPLTSAPESVSVYGATT